MLAARRQLERTLRIKVEVEKELDGLVGRLRSCYYEKGQDAKKIVRAGESVEAALERAYGSAKYHVKSHEKFDSDNCRAAENYHPLSLLDECHFNRGMPTINLLSFCQKRHGSLGRIADVE